MKRRTHIFLFAFLALQLVLPVRGFVRDKVDSQSNFSWNMYSRKYSCRIQYTLQAENGQARLLDHKSYFVRRQKVTKIMHRDSLPYFHEWLCDELAEERQWATLEGAVSCRINDGERVTLVERGTSICTEPAYGVVQR